MTNRIYWGFVPEPCKPTFPYGAAETQYHLWPEVKSPPAHRYWLALSTFYDEKDLPHLQQFKSFEALPEQVTRADLDAISAKMKAAVPQREAKIRNSWKRVFEHVLETTPDDDRPAAVPKTFEGGMRELWGETVDGAVYEAEKKQYDCATFARGVPLRGYCDEWVPFPF